MLYTDLPTDPILKRSYTFGGDPVTPRQAVALGRLLDNLETGEWSAIDAASVLRAWAGPPTMDEVRERLG